MTFFSSSIFDSKNSIVFWCFSNKNVKKIPLFLVFKNVTFNLILSFSFQVKSVMPSVTVKITLNIYIFMFLRVFFLQPYIFLYVFHYFGHNGRPASQISNPRLSFDHFNQAIILIKKNCNLGVLRFVWDKSSQDWWFWALKFYVWALKYV